MSTSKKLTKSAVRAERNGAAVEKLPAPAEHWEARVARWLGVSLRRVRVVRRRELAEGTDWRVVDKEVVYTKAGLERLQARLGAAGLVLEPRAEERAEPVAPVGPPKRAKATVKKVYHNSRLILVALPDEQAAVVFVRDNSNFAPGMVVEVTHDARLNRWQYCGRLPRQKGRL